VISDVVLSVILAIVAVLAVPRFGATGLAVAYLTAYIATCLVIAPTVVIASRKTIWAREASA
jgi:O-antigen/teichoic acid export membrane protein